MALESPKANDDYLGNFSGAIRNWPDCRTKLMKEREVS